MDIGDMDNVVRVDDEIVTVDFTEKVAGILGIERYEGRPCDFFLIIAAMRSVFDSLRESGDGKED